MRIIGGTHRGRVITPDHKFKARPTTDFAKENLFNLLHHSREIAESRVLDLFSGTGSISFEFASRGAGQIIAVEANYHHYTFIKHTAAALGFSQITIYKTDVFQACKKLKNTPFDFIFADPPFDLPRIAEIPDALFSNQLLAPEGIAVIEHPGSVDFSSHPFFKEHRRYGSVNFSLFQRNLSAFPPSL